MTILNILVAVLGLHQLIFWLYWLQVKEYRLDRLWSSLKKEWLWLFMEQWNLRRWYRPKLTMRIGLALTLGVSLIFLEYFLLKNLFLLLLIFVPIQVILVNFFLAPVFDFLKRKKIAQAKHKLESFKGIVVGVTGSFGKSSTKELLALVLSKKFKVFKTPENHNTLIGVAKAVLEKMKGDEDIFVVEMGAYKRGEIKEICDLVKPKVGIITGIGDQHLDLFGSLGNIRKTKYELFDAIPKNGLKLLAGEDFSVNDLKNLKQEKEYLDFYLDGERCRMPILGKSLALNIAGVIKVARFFGLNSSEIAKALNQLPKNTLYPKLVKISRDVYLIDDSYSASLESFLSALDYLKVYDGFKKIVVTPGMIELGKKTREDHLAVGKALGFVDKVIVTKAANFRELNTSNNAVLIKDFGKIVRVIKDEVGPKTVILLKGRMPLGLIEAMK